MRTVKSDQGHGKSKLTFPTPDVKNLVYGYYIVSHSSSTMIIPVTYFLNCIFRRQYFTEVYLVTNADK